MNNKKGPNSDSPSLRKHTLSRRDFLKGFASSALGISIAPKLIKPSPVSDGQRQPLTFLSEKTVKLIINRKEYLLHIRADETLLEVLRERLALTGTKQKSKFSAITRRNKALPLWKPLSVW